MALTPEKVAEKQFTLGLRGYDKDEVRSYLQTVAVGLREAIDAASVAATLREAVAQPGSDAPAVDGHATALSGAAATPDWSNLGEEIALVLRTAHEQANRLRANAESQAATVREQAQQDADADRGAAEQDRAEAAAALESAQHESLDLVASAQARIDDRLAKAKETAAREAEASVAELTAQIAELTGTRDHIRAELSSMRSRIDGAITPDSNTSSNTSNNTAHGATSDEKVAAS